MIWTSESKLNDGLSEPSQIYMEGASNTHINLKYTHKFNTIIIRHHARESMIGYISPNPRLWNKKTLNEEGINEPGSVVENSTKHPTGGLHAETAVEHTLVWLTERLLKKKKTNTIKKDGKGSRERDSTFYQHKFEDYSPSRMRATRRRRRHAKMSGCYIKNDYSKRRER